MATSLCRTVVLFSLLAALLSSRALAERYAVDWPTVNPEILERFTQLIRIDTSNPPGNETRAANHVKGILDREGVSSQLFALEPERANLVARIKGNGSKRPVLIMGHTDVVGVQREKWSVDPFAAIRKDGFIYGRGAQDDKDNLTASLIVMILLKRMDVKLDRDVIFLAESGEEGTTKPGIDYMVSQHWPEIDAEFAMAEGGYVSARKGKVRFVEITTTEKVPRGIRLIAHGTAGHGSRPTPDNAVIHLAAAVAKVGAWQPPPRLNDTTRTYFERLATISSPDDASRYHHAAEPASDRYFARHEPGHFSILRTSVVPTILKAGFKNNVIPSDGEAYLDVRALPDEDMDQFCATLRKLIDDPHIEVLPPRLGGRPAGTPSRLDTEMFAAIEKTQRRMFPGAITIPAMLTGATDMAQLRAKGVQAYGFGGIAEENSPGGAHTDDERIAEDSLYKLVQFLWYSVIEVAASK